MRHRHMPRGLGLHLEGLVAEDSTTSPPGRDATRWVGGGGRVADVGTSRTGQGVSPELQAVTAKNKTNPPAAVLDATARCEKPRSRRRPGGAYQWPGGRAAGCPTTTVEPPRGRCPGWLRGHLTTMVNRQHHRGRRWRRSRRRGQTRQRVRCVAAGGGATRLGVPRSPLARQT